MRMIHARDVPATLLLDDVRREWPCPCPSAFPHPKHVTVRGACCLLASPLRESIAALLEHPIVKIKISTKGKRQQVHAPPDTSPAA